MQSGKKAKCFLQCCSVTDFKNTRGGKSKSATAASRRFTENTKTVCSSLRWGSSWHIFVCVCSVFIFRIRYDGRWVTQSSASVQINSEGVDVNSTLRRDHTELHLLCFLCCLYKSHPLWFRLFYCPTNKYKIWDALIKNVLAVFVKRRAPKINHQFL